MNNCYQLICAFLMMVCFGCAPNTEGNQTAPKSTTSPTEGIVDDYEDFGRATWQKPNLVISQFGDLTNKTIADIGAGTGFFSKRLSAKAARVIAIDIDERFIDILDSIRLSELPEEFQERLEPRIAKLDDPLLASYETDGVLIVNTFMYMSERTAYLEKVKNGIKPGGKLVIVDFKKRWTPIGPPAQIRLDMEEAISYIEEAGFKIARKDMDTLEYQYILVAERV